MHCVLQEREVWQDNKREQCPQQVRQFHRVAAALCKRAGQTPTTETVCSSHDTAREKYDDYEHLVTRRPS